MTPFLLLIFMGYFAVLEIRWCFPLTIWTQTPTDFFSTMHCSIHFFFFLRERVFHSIWKDICSLKSLGDWIVGAHEAHVEWSDYNRLCMQSGVLEMHEAILGTSTAPVEACAQHPRGARIKPWAHMAPGANTRALDYTRCTLGTLL